MVAVRVLGFMGTGSTQSLCALFWQASLLPPEQFSYLENEEARLSDLSVVPPKIHGLGILDACRKALHKGENFCLCPVEGAGGTELMASIGKIVYAVTSPRIISAVTPFLRTSMYKSEA